MLVSVAAVHVLEQESDIQYLALCQRAYRYYHFYLGCLQRHDEQKSLPTHYQGLLGSAAQGFSARLLYRPYQMVV